MNNCKQIIETDRLILRELTENDFDALFAVLGDAEVKQHYPNVFDENEVREWIHRNMERYRIFSFGLWAVVLKKTSELIEDCGITMQLIGGKIKPEIGFQNTPFNILYSYMKYTNVGSYRTAISAGMKQVDEFPDEVNEITKVFAITREQWMALKKDSLK